MKIKSTDFILHREFFSKRQKRVNELTLHEKIKKEYLKRNRLAIAMLTREIDNPLVKNGELYLTYDSISLILTGLMLDRYPKVFLDFNNIFILRFEKDFVDCLAIFSNKNCFVRIIYFLDMHTVIFVISRTQEGTNILCIDSIPDLELTRLEKIILDFFPHANLFRNCTQIQYDYSSCAVFSIKVLLFFNSAERFIHYTKRTRSFKERTEVSERIYNLKITDLPNPLIKLNQKNYFVKSRLLLFNGKLYNPKSVIFKYYLIGILNIVLEKIIINNNVTMSNSDQTFTSFTDTIVNWFSDLTPRRRPFKCILYKLNLIRYQNYESLLREHELYLDSSSFLFKNKVQDTDFLITDMPAEFIYHQIYTDIYPKYFFRIKEYAEHQRFPPVPEEIRSSLNYATDDQVSFKKILINGKNAWLSHTKPSVYVEGTDSFNIIDICIVSSDRISSLNDVQKQIFYSNNRKRMFKSWIKKDIIPILVMFPNLMGIIGRGDVYDNCRYCTPFSNCDLMLFFNVNIATEKEAIFLLRLLFKNILYYSIDFILYFFHDNGYFGESKIFYRDNFSSKQLCIDLFCIPALLHHLKKNNYIDPYNKSAFFNEKNRLLDTTGKLDKLLNKMQL